jgi:hypothetical protein
MQAALRSTSLVSRLRAEKFCPATHISSNSPSRPIAHTGSRSALHAPFHVWSVLAERQARPWPHCLNSSQLVSTLNSNSNSPRPNTPSSTDTTTTLSFAPARVSSRTSNQKRASSTALATSAEPAKAAATVTVEYQRQQAKAMQKFLREKSLEKEIADAQVFGWTRNNELGNGRWVMMGLAIGLLTEYATGVSFIEQLKLMVSYMGVIDLD